MHTTYLPCRRSLLPIRRSPSQPPELADDHLDDLRVELRPVALRAPAAAIPVAVLLLLGLFAAVFTRLLFAILLLLLLALAPSFSPALL